MNVSVDERMVKSKGRSDMRQFIRNKAVRFGFKLWVMAESSTGYTLDFSVYTGRRGNSTENGLAYDVVLMVCESLYKQGYHVYFDIFFTSPRLLQILYSLGLIACGTCCENRRGFPLALRGGRWAKTAQRGQMRYMRSGNVLALQWMDNKVYEL